MDREEFRNPGAIWRAAPFWSWNDALENDELAWQARDMKKHGWGGYFMHGRIGLVTPYLSDEWMDRVRHTVALSAEEGLCAYLYDEDKWPSGYAGGIVPRQDAAYRNTMLQCTRTAPPAATNTVLALYAKANGDWRRIESEGEASGDEIAYISRWIEPMGNPWFNGTTYVDLMNPEAVEAFIDCTLEPYARLVGEHFGGAIPGCFTDEPSYVFWHTTDHVDRHYTVPWTAKFAEKFREKWGYDLLDHAMAIFEKTGDWRLVRYHFWRTATELFLAAFSEPYGRWCREHNLKMTGHYMLEDTFAGQIRWIGAAMPHYEHMGWPGMDHLGRNIGDVMTARQVSSVCHQLGKERALSELYGCAGHNFSFEGRKWLADWHFVHGINLMNPHLTLYSMRGERKRDFPPTISWAQPYWRYNRLVADYKARLSYLLTRGKRVAQVLVIHSIESAWALFEPGNEDSVRGLNDAFDKVTRWLLDAHVDFDYGDESLLATYGSVEKDGFRVGEATYDLVVVPPAETLRGTTLGLLRQWMEHEGPVIAVKPIPRLVDGSDDRDAWDVLREAIVVESDDQDFTGTLAGLIDPMVQVLSPEGFPVAPVWIHTRTDGDRDIVFLANTDRSRGYECEIVLRGEGAVEQWDPLTGKITPIPVERAGSHVVVATYLDPTGSLLLVQDHSMESVPIDDHEHAEAVDEIELDGAWRIARQDPNALTLDLARWRLEGSALGNGARWHGPEPLWKALAPVCGHTGTFVLEFAVDVEEVPEGEVFLVLETPEKFRIEVNDELLPDEDAGWWVDKSFKKRRITGLLHEDVNTIRLTGEGAPDIELESMYLTGAFGVWTDDSRTFFIGAEPEEAPGGDLVEQGYPFFAGTISLEQEIDLSLDTVESARLVLGGVEAIVADVWVNGRNAGQMIWSPYEVEIGRLLTDGTNTIRVDIVGSLRNLLGPHHDKRGELLAVGPWNFTDPGRYTDIYQFVPFGLNDARIVVITELDGEDEE